MTSNIGSRSAGQAAPGGSGVGQAGVGAAEEARTDADQGIEDVDGALLAELGTFFRPEFLNRIGDIVRFGALSREHLRLIVDIQLRKVQKLLDARGLGLSVSDEAKVRLVELGYEPAFGARPLERTIIRQVQDPVAEGLLAGTFKSGQTIRVELEGDRVTLRAEAASS
jgi:ATP-dependent Clp protease ATP-binding subunit ClpB